MDEKVPIKSAKTVFEVLEALAGEEMATLAEVTEAVDMPRSTTHDYLRTLSSLQYVVKHGRHYRVSTRSLALGVRVREKMPLYQLAKPELHKLAEQTGETVSLMIEEHNMGVLLSILQGEHAFDLGVSEGWRLELSTCAPGKAILAHFPDRRIEEVLDVHGLPKITEETITDRDALYEELEEIRDRGYALDFSERLEGVRAVSVPLMTQGTVHGALTISGPTNRMTEERINDGLVDSLRQSADIVEIRYTLERD